MAMEIADLNFRLSKTELEAKEATENLAKYRKEETDQENRLQQLQTDRDAARAEQQKAEVSLAVSYSILVFYIVLYFLIK